VQSCKGEQNSMAMKNSVSTDKPRFQLVDTLRGTAILMMFTFHFSFDLNYFGFIQTDFYHNPFWLNYRILIVSTFLFVMGISLYLAHHKGLQTHKYLRRLSILLACAALVSLGSYLAFPHSMIFFGILHFIAAATILGLPFVRLYWTNLIVGITIIVIGTQVQHPFFDQAPLQWIGLMTHKPITEDYVPLFPWLGVVLLGIFFGRWAYTARHFPALSQWRSDIGPVRLLRFGGRHSLLIYMVHQPIFIGSLYLVSFLLHR
jgi:uncharacterized membrane protein